MLIRLPVTGNDTPRDRSLNLAQVAVRKSDISRAMIDGIFSRSPLKVRCGVTACAVK